MNAACERQGKVCVCGGLLGETMDGGMSEVCLPKKGRLLGLREIVMEIGGLG